jgi:hypothetical protein
MKRGKIVWVAAIASGAALFVACTNAKETTGVLGNGQFVYDCQNAMYDSYCQQNMGSGGTLTMPSEIAVGALFSVDYQPTNSNGTGVTEGSTGFVVNSASTELAQSMGSSVLGKRSGYDALLATHSGVATIDDFMIQQFVDVATVQAAEATVSLSAGSTQFVGVTPLDSFNNTLAGQLACTWTVTAGQDVVSVQTASTYGGVTLVAVGDGSATVHASCGNVATDVRVSVTGSAPLDGGVDGATDGGSHG